jgi:hypothetical protein
MSRKHSVGGELMTTVRLELVTESGGTDFLRPKESFQEETYARARCLGQVEELERPCTTRRT